MKISKKSSSQASWSLLAEGVASARVEAHNVRSFFDQMKSSIDSNEDLKEEIYKMCGDNLLSIPKILDKLERNLDKTNYALIIMGKDFYRQKLTHEDRERVDMASKYNSSVRKVARLFMAGKGKNFMVKTFPQTLGGDVKKGQTFLQILRSMLKKSDFKVLKSSDIQGVIYSSESTPSYVDNSGVPYEYYSEESEGVVGQNMLLEYKLSLKDIRSALSKNRIDTSKLMSDFGTVSKNDLRMLGIYLSQSLSQPTEFLIEEIDDRIYKSESEYLLSYGEVEEFSFDITDMGVVGSDLVIKEKVMMTKDGITFQQEDFDEYM